MLQKYATKYIILHDEYTILVHFLNHSFHIVLRTKTTILLTNRYHPWTKMCLYFFYRDFQFMKPILDDNYLTSNQNTNQFLM